MKDRDIRTMSKYPRKMDEVMVAMDSIVLVWRYGEIGTFLRGLQNLAGHSKRTKLVYTSDVLYHETRFYVISTWCRRRLIGAVLYCTVVPVPAVR
jgi:hypothetical protein